MSLNTYETLTAKITFPDGGHAQVFVSEQDGTVAFSPTYLGKLIEKYARPEYHDLDVTVRLPIHDVARIFGPVEVSSNKEEKLSSEG